LRIATLTIVVAAMAVGATAAAQTPTDDSGVRYDDGLVVRAADGRWLKLEGAVQARYAAVFAGGLQPDTAGFELQRARLIASGAPADALRFRSELELTASPVVLDAYVAYQLRDHLAVRAGAYKTPLCRSYAIAGTRLAFPDRPAAVERMRFDRDLGVAVVGSAAGDRLGFAFSVQNGAGRDRLNDNVDALVVARADVAVVGVRIDASAGDLADSKTPRLTVGAGVAHDLVASPSTIGDYQLDTDVDGDGEHDNVQVVMASADAVLRYRRVEAVVEGVWRHERWGSIFDGQNDPTRPSVTEVVGTNANRDYLGVYAQATYVALPARLLVGARAGYVQLPFLGLTGRASELPPANRRVDVELLAALYRRGYRFLAASYGVTDYDLGTTDHRLMVDALVKW